MTRRFCQRCGDTMILEYRMWRGELRWQWWCPSCRCEELAKPCEYEPTAEDTVEAGCE